MGKKAETINQILQNPYIYKYSNSLYEYYLAGMLINDALNKVDIKSKIAIWGGGLHTCHLYKLLTMDNKKKIQYIIDKEIKEDIYGLEKEYIPVDYKDISYFDVIVVSAFARRKEIEQEIKNINRKIKIIDLYDSFDKFGISDERCFYENVDYSYIEITKTLYELQMEQDVIKNNVLIKKIIGEYLHIRDFENAFFYMNKILKVNEEDYTFYLNLMKKLKQYLNEIKNIIDNSDHIIVNWIDALRPEETCNMPFLLNKKEKGVYFDEAHTVAPYTSATIKTIFTGKRYLDDYLYKMDNFNELVQSKLYQIIIQNGYQFEYFGAKGRTGILFNKKTISYFYFKIEPYKIPSTVWQWEAIDELENESSKPKFIIIHNLCETHCPNMNGIEADCRIVDEKDIYRVFGNKKEADQKNIVNQIALSQKYLDAQLSFYYSIYENVKYHIFLSDHGQYRGEQPICVRGYSHIFLLILGDNIIKSHIKKVFSLVNFPQLIELLMNNMIMQVETICSEYAEIQSDDCYSEKIFNRFSVNPNAYKDFYIQHRGVITSKDIYLKMITGEEYYLVKGKNCNLINDNEYTKRIEELKKKAGNKFIDIRTEKKYLYSQKLYKALNIQIHADINYL